MTVARRFALSSCFSFAALALIALDMAWASYSPRAFRITAFTTFTIFTAFTDFPRPESSPLLCHVVTIVHGLPNV